MKNIPWKRKSKSEGPVAGRGSGSDKGSGCWWGPAVDVRDGRCSRKAHLCRVKGWAEMGVFCRE